MLSAQDHTTRFGRRQAGLDAFPDQITLELGQARHDGSHQLAAGGAQVKAQSGLCKDAHLPAVKVVAYPSPRASLHLCIGRRKALIQLARERHLHRARHSRG
jgi:hypothetical protein